MSDNHYYQRKEESRWEVATMTFKFTFWAAVLLGLLWLTGLASCTPAKELPAPISRPQLIPDTPAPAFDGCRVLIDKSTGKEFVVCPNNTDHE